MFQVKLWDLAQKHCIRTVQAHEGYIRGVTFLPDGEHFLTVGDDKCVKMWETSPDEGTFVEPTDTVFSKVCCVQVVQHSEA